MDMPSELGLRDSGGLLQVDKKQIIFHVERRAEEDSGRAQQVSVFRTCQVGPMACVPFAEWMGKTEQPFRA